MSGQKSILKYCAFALLAFGLVAASYALGKAPRLIRGVVLQLQKDLQHQHGIRVDVGAVAIEGFLTVRIDGFELEKKDIHLLIRSQSVRARLSPWLYFKAGNPVSRLEINEPEVLATIESKGSSEAGLSLNFSLPELVIRRARAEIHWKNQVFQVLDLNAKAHLSPNQAQIDWLSVETPELKLMTEGTLKLDTKQALDKGSALRLWLSGRLQRIPELRRLKTKLEGDVELYAHLRADKGMVLEGQIKASDVHIDQVQIHSIQGPFVLNPQFVELRGVEVGIAGATPKVSGRLSLDKELHIVAEIDGASLSLNELLSDLNVKKAWVDSKLDAHASIQGQIFPAFFLKGRMAGKIRDFKVQDPKGLILRTACTVNFDTDLEIDKHDFQFKKAKLQDGKSTFILDSSLFLDKRHGMRLEGKALVFDFASIHNQIAEDTYRGVGSAQLSVYGPYEHLKIQSQTQIESFYWNDWPFGTASGLLTFEDNRLQMTEIQGKEEFADYTGQLNIDFDRAGLDKLSGLVKARLTGEQSGDIEIRADNAEVFLDTFQVKSPYGDAQATASYDRKNRIGSGSLKVQNSFFGSADLDLAIEHDRLHAVGTAPDSQAKLKLQVALEKRFDYTLSASMPYGPLRALMPKVAWLDRYQAQAALEAKAKGSLSELKQSEVQLELSPTVFYVGDLKLLAMQNVEAVYAQEKLLIPTVLFRSAHGDEIRLSAELSEKNFQLDLKSQADLWFLTGLDDRIEGAYGALDASVRVQGPWQQLNYEGHVRVAPKSYLSLRDYPPGLKNVTADIDFSGSKAQLSATGEAERGHFQVQGAIDLHEGRFENLRAQLAQVPVYYSSFLTGVADGFLALQGSFADPTLSGRLEFSDMFVTKELDPKALKAPRSRAQKQPLQFDVSLTTKKPIRVESKSFHGELSGDLKLVGTSNSPGLLGELKVLSGEVYFRNQYYHVLKARADFDNPFRMLPFVDVEANAQIMDYDVTVRAQGDLANPKLIFSSRPSLPQSDLLSLITFGFLNRDNPNNIGAAGTAGLEALSVYSGIGDKVLKAFPGLVVDELRLGTLYNQASGGVSSSVVIGMEVFRGMRLRFQSALLQNSFGNREKRLELEKYISNRWRWRLIWDSVGFTNFGDAGADLWVRWEL